MFFKEIQSKIQSWDEAQQTVREWQSQGERVVFTNGCFDLMHYGHVHYLADAKDCGNRLVVGVNADESVQRLKGPQRPIQDERSRIHVLASLACVDLVVLFKEDTPLDLITMLQPNVLVKGGDWLPQQIVGSEVVLAKGGEVFSLPYMDGFSTTSIEEKIRKA